MQACKELKTPYSFVGEGRVWVGYRERKGGGKWVRDNKRMGGYVGMVSHLL